MINWHNRYLQQSAWTSELRAYLFKKAGLSGARTVLEVGCGTGAILSAAYLPKVDLSTPQPALYGVDISPEVLKECHKQVPSALLTCGDAVCLPYPDKSFDISYCHFLLLWVSDPLRALAQMKRVTRSQGYILAMAEPDYTARIDKPRELSWLGKQQTESLINQGADVSLGSRLADLFYRAGIRLLETGLIKSLNKETTSFKAWENEWEVFETDLAGIVKEEEIQKIKKLDEQAWRRGEHTINVPTYFAWGQV
jgi:ubiquinone/menaquinone biosynthesis C-methylase UbiE